MTKAPTSAVLKRILFTLGFLAILTTLPVIWTLVRNIDNEMRETLIVQANIASKAVDPYEIMKLTGTEADLNNVTYQRIKDQLMSMRTVNRHYRFIYLMGMHTGEKPFFLVDSESPSSPDYSPPGQTYDEATDKLINVFHSQVGFVEGPMTDQWGTWVSAIAPVFNPRTGNVMAVIGIDVGADRWHLEIAQHVLPAVGFMIAFLGLMLACFYIALKRIGD